MTPPCVIEDCPNLNLARGLCSRHYQQWRRGDCDRSGPLKKQPPEVRFWAKVNKTDSCWLWTAATDKDGYGLFTIAKRRMIRAHHYLAGKPTPGLVWDHLCRARSCVRPDHLEMVSNAENIRRGEIAIHQTSKTHCPQGHPYDEANTYWMTDRKGRRGRACRTCRTERDRQRPSGWQRNRAKAAQLAG